MNWAHGFGLYFICVTAYHQIHFFEEFREKRISLSSFLCGWDALCASLAIGFPMGRLLGTFVDLFLI
jgi:hypothetical protein